MKSIKAHRARMLKRITIPFTSENEFESKLQDSRIICCSQLTELSVRQNRVGVLRTEAIHHVEHFRAEFETLLFANLEGPGERHVKRPGRRTDHTVSSEVAQGP